MSAAPNVNASSLFKNLDGFYMSSFLDEDTVQSAMSYKPRYEDLQKDIKTWVLNIADFLGEEYGQKLRHDNVLLDKIVKATSFESLKKTVNDGMKTLMHDLFSLPPERQLKSLQVYSQRSGGRPKLELKQEFLRKGILGDYKNLFSDEQIRRMKGRIASKTKGSDVMNLWIDIGLP
ncbi:sulfotransferase 1C2-like isoform X2 [Ixodes scapularis]|uniref:sulfotransferase 1C2-like isoform X2 n=1 Tax=Ixodes scapularis TaxID=6945 RepID=UPI001A9FDEEC|nr:sulfotransferase 1C2-like isoform X2 [Ixodes scapularis]